MSRHPRINPAFNELEKLWYERIRFEAGFDDIENLSDPDRGLMIWHSSNFLKPEVALRAAKRSHYQDQIDTFANDPTFLEITELMVRHGNSRFGQAQVEHIWELHRNGQSQRRIAIEMGCSKSCIHFMLERMREWMRLTV